MEHPCPICGTEMEVKTEPDFKNFRCPHNHWEYTYDQGHYCYRVGSVWITCRYSTPEKEIVVAMDTIDALKAMAIKDWRLEVEYSIIVPKTDKQLSY